MFRQVGQAINRRRCGAVGSVAIVEVQPTWQGFSALVLRVTAALDAGVPLCDVKEAASHVDPRPTMRYDRGRVSLGRHATCIVTTYLAGAAR